MAFSQRTSQRNVNPAKRRNDVNYLIELGKWAEKNGINLNKSSINFDAFIASHERKRLEKDWAMDSDTISFGAVSITMWHDQNTHKTFQKIKRICGGLEKCGEDSTILVTPWMLVPCQEVIPGNQLRVFRISWHGAFECTTTTNCVFRGFKEDK
jgi:hypothetical protein